MPELSDNVLKSFCRWCDNVLTTSLTKLLCQVSLQPVAVCFRSEDESPSLPWLPSHLGSAFKWIMCILVGRNIKKT